MDEKRDDYDDDECVVCFEQPMACRTELTCGHAFCHACASAWTTRHRSACPVCAEPVYRLHCPKAAALRSRVVHIHPFAEVGVSVAQMGPSFVVERVKPRSTAALEGVLAGDRVLAADGRALAGIGDLEAAVRGAAVAQRMLRLCVAPCRTIRGARLRGTVVHFRDCGAPIVVYTPKRGPLREGEQLFACGGVAKPSQWRGVVRCFCYGVFTSDNGVDVVLIS